MKRILLLSAICFLFASQSNAIDGSVSFGVFYDALQPYGEWVTAADFGYCWHPYGVEQNWRPYTNGRWAWTDDGWFWVSYENWGWAPYHYGRWAYDNYYGWVWIPDYEWGPSWVQWRISNGYVGWAPLPPRAGWHMSIGFDADDFGIPYFGWCFTSGNGFYSDHPVFFGVERNHYLLRTTRNVTNIYIGGNRVINRGPDYKTIERMGRIRISPVRIVDERNPNAVRDRSMDGDRVRIYRPQVKPDTRSEFENRVRQSDRGSRGGREYTRPSAPDTKGGRQEDMRRTNRMNERSDDAVINPQESGQKEEMKNFHPQPNNQPRFNIPQRREESKREMAPAAPQNRDRQPQVERRRGESRPQMERGNRGGERRGGSGEKRR